MTEIAAENKRCLDAAIELARIQQSDAFGGPDGFVAATGVIGERYAAHKIGISAWPTNTNQKGWDFLDIEGRRVQVKSQRHSVGWCRIITGAQVKAATGKTGHLSNRLSTDEVRSTFANRWDRLALVRLSERIEPTLVGCWTIDELIEGHHLNSDGNGIYIEPTADLSGLRVYPEAQRALA
jgi:hypothetical protein